MRNSKSRMMHALRAAVLCSAAWAIWPTATQAAIDLSATDLSKIGNAVTTAINDAKANLPPNATREQRDAAIAAAISAETQDLIKKYNGANPMVISEAIIAAAVDDGAPPAAIGTGLATAAVAEGSTVGIEIA